MIDLSQLKRSIAVSKKNLRIYYLKGPVLIFGIILPFFFFLAFWLGREMSHIVLGTGLIGMALWFTATSISPVITPWENRTKTLEWLISAPIGHSWILIGDILASATLGIILTIIPLSIALIILKLSIESIIILILGLIASTLCFSTIGVLMAAYPTDTPADVMMLSSIIKFPIIFVSGIFIPINKLPTWGRSISYLSPLTYFVDLLKWTFGGKKELWLTPQQDLVIITAFTIIFFALALYSHKKTLSKRL
ncbi:MAG: ABC-type multidrug transport system, permease component [Candidatus Methanohalarchaeum thermophilum]|uniref:ABC-type multidrug transport system, permease component n=1 Tax=Methanohalarchaeum thermophilum TaxID=1903181 RepID=A0A1Q6DXP5_METT1|nr:MAG: ABC-type multidrug transport system, permease component [Candidatus Methanohalarchaeum thermophilum]